MWEKIGLYFLIILDLYATKKDCIMYFFELFRSTINIIYFWDQTTGLLWFYNLIYSFVHSFIHLVNMC